MQRTADLANSEWADLARRERIYLAVIYGFIPMMVLLLILATAIAGDVPGWFGIIAGIGGIGAFYAASAHLRNFRCPRCSEPFADPVGGPGKSCVHCHAPRGTAPHCSLAAREIAQR